MFYWCQKSVFFPIKKIIQFITMGQMSSNFKKKTVIGRSNITAPEIYALYNLEDKTKFFSSVQNKNLPMDLILNYKIRKINYKIFEKLKKSPSIITKNNFIKSNYLEAIKDPIYLTQNTLKAAKRNEDINYSVQDNGKLLIICKSNIFELYDNFKELKALVSMQLCCNYIYKIPPSIRNLQNLKTLVLYRNQLRNLPDEICDLKNLLVLDVSYNFLEDLPQNFNSLKLLNHLNLENNCFEKLPVIISKLQSLKTLNILNNNFKTIPLEILKMPFLMEFFTNVSNHIEENFQQNGEFSLKEICSRNLIRNNLKVSKYIDKPLIKYLSDVEECGFCGGPLFEYYFDVYTMQYWEGSFLPINYKICKKHYSTHEKRIYTLFSREHKTIPYKLLFELNSSVNDIFIKRPKCYNKKLCFYSKNNGINLKKMLDNFKDKGRSLNFRNIDDFFYF